MSLETDSKMLRSRGHVSWWMWVVVFRCWCFVCKCWCELSNARLITTAVAVMMTIGGIFLSQCFDTAGSWQQGHPACRKSCTINHWRFFFGSTPGDPALPGVISRKVGGTGVSGLMRGLATLPPRWTREPSVVRDKDGRPPRGPSGSALLLCV